MQSTHGHPAQPRDPFSPAPTSYVSLSAPGQGPQGGAGSCHQHGPGCFFGARGTAGGDSRSEGGGQLPAGIYLPRSSRHRDPQPDGTVGASPAWGAGWGGTATLKGFVTSWGLFLSHSWQPARRQALPGTMGALCRPPPSPPRTHGRGPWGGICSGGVKQLLG